MLIITDLIYNYYNNRNKSFLASFNFIDAVYFIGK